MPSEPDCLLRPATQRLHSSDRSAALKAWIARAGIRDGAVFRGIDQWGNIKPRAFNPAAVNLILKTRIAPARLDPTCSAPMACVPAISPPPPAAACPLPDAMQQSQHRSVNQAARYYNSAERPQGRAARLIV